MVVLPYLLEPGTVHPTLLTGLIASILNEERVGTQECAGVFRHRLRAQERGPALDSKDVYIAVALDRGTEPALIEDLNEEPVLTTCVVFSNYQLPKNRRPSEVVTSTPHIAGTVFADSSCLYHTEFSPDQCFKACSGALFNEQKVRQARGESRWNFIHQSLTSQQGFEREMLSLPRPSYGVFDLWANVYVHPQKPPEAVLAQLVSKQMLKKTAAQHLLEKVSRITGQDFEEICCTLDAHIDAFDQYDAEARRRWQGRGKPKQLLP